MMWGQRINVYTDHKNLTQDGLGLPSNRVTRWRILLEEYTPKIINIKVIHNADALSHDWIMILSLTLLTSTIMQRM